MIARFIKFRLWRIAYLPMSGTELPWDEDVMPYKSCARNVFSGYCNYRAIYHRLLPGTLPCICLLHLPPLRVAFNGNVNTTFRDHTHTLGMTLD